MLLVVPTSAAHSRGLPVEAVDEHHLIERAALLTLIGMSKYLQIEEGHVHDAAICVLTAALVGIFGGLSVIGLLGMREPKGKLFALRLGTVILIDELIQPRTWVVGHGDVIDDDPLNISLVEAVPHPQ